MQPKVSMVMPCYNKVKWIGGMFDSILAQEWDNIELILVNDGSTDGTREIITAYEPKFRKRGFEVVIIDQENQGVGTAVKNGMLRMTGDFVCIPDCDDELDPEYLSVMAGWLYDHPEDNWVVCDSSKFNFYRAWYDAGNPKNVVEYPRYPYRLAESYLMHRQDTGVYIIMLRKSFLDSCHVVDRFCIEYRATQEAQIWLPLALSGNEPVWIQRTLYKCFVREGSITQSAIRSYEKRLEWLKQRCELTRDTFFSYCEPNDYNNFLFDIGMVEHYNHYLGRYSEYDEPNELKKLVEIIVRSGMSFDGFSLEAALASGIGVALWHISNKLIGRERNKSVKICRSEDGRIIAYAAFGMAAKRAERGLLNSDIRPDVYWDINAKDGDSSGTVPVTLPDFDNLSHNDTILMLVEDKTIIREVTSQIAERALCSIIYANDIMDYLAEYYYA